MNVCWCSLGVISMVDDMVVDGSFNVLVVCVLFFDVDCRKNRANSPRERFSVEDLGFPGEATRKLQSNIQLHRGTPKRWGEKIQHRSNTVQYLVQYCCTVVLPVTVLTVHKNQKKFNYWFNVFYVPKRQLLR